MRQAYCQARPRGAGGAGSGSGWPGRSLQPQPGGRGSLAPRREALSAGVLSSSGAGRREEPSAVTASSGRRLLLYPRLLRLVRPPAQSAALGPAEPGGLSGRRRLSATVASRGARRPGTSATPGTPTLPRAAASCHRRGDAGTLGRAPPGLRFSYSRRGKSGESRAAAPGASAPRPLPPRLGAGGGGGGGGGKCASFPGGERFTSRQRLRLPVA